MLKRNALVEMTGKVTGASATSVKIIVVEEDGNKSPCINRPKRKNAFNRLDEFDFEVKRRMTYSFYARGNSPRLAKPHSEKLKMEINFSYSISRLCPVLIKLGLQFGRKAR